MLSFTSIIIAAMSDLKTSFELSLEKSAYHPGDVVRGILSLMSSPHEPAIQSVEIEVKGEEETGDDTISSDFDKQIFSIKRSVPISGIFPLDKSAAVEIPFSFQLPLGIPPTFKSPEGHVTANIHYTVSASVTLDHPTDEPLSMEGILYFYRSKDLEIFVIPRKPSAPSSIVPLVSKGEQKLYRCMGCCFQRGTMTVKCTVDKNYYTAGDDSVLKFSYSVDCRNPLEKEIKKMNVSIVRGLHIATGYQGSLERHRDLEVVVDPISVKKFDQNDITINLPHIPNPLPWIIGTTIRSMYYVKLEIVSKDYPDDPYVFLTPILLVGDLSTNPIDDAPADWTLGTAGKNQLGTVRAVYQTLAADMQIRTLDNQMLTTPKSAKVDFGFLKRFGIISKSQIFL